ncbi:MAG: MG2 domain-containing protein, partial [Bacteroidota bacterium]
EYAVFNCSGALRATPAAYQGEQDNQNLKTISQESNLDENGEIRSIWGDYYGIDGYYEGFQWQHRSNPCFGAYYNFENFTQTNVLASDLGITAKGGNDGSMFVAVADLRSTKSVGDCELEFYDFQQQLLGTAKTNGDGVAELKLDKKCFLIIAKKEKQKGYLKTADGNALSLSRFDVAGEVAQKGLKGYIYGERGVWRPGDSLHLNFILEDKAGTLPKNYPISFELTDARGQLQYKTVTTKNTENLYAIPLATSPDAPTGNWIAVVKAGGARFEKVLKIETVKPNRLKINLDFGKAELTSRDEPATAKMQVDWLHGAPGSNLKTVVEAQVSSVKTEFKGFADYEFDDPARRVIGEPVTIFDGTTDKNGSATVRASFLADKSTAPGKLKVNLRARAFEKGGDASVWNSTVGYSPFAAYAGVLIPNNQQGEP